MSNKIIAYFDFSFATECQWRWEVSPPLRWRRKNVHLQEEIQNQMTFKGREVVTVVQTPEAVEKVQWFQTVILWPVLSTLILTMDLLSKHFRKFSNLKLLVCTMWSVNDGVAGEPPAATSLMDRRICLNNFIFRLSSYVGQHSHMTSDVLGAFLTYLPALISLCSKIRCSLTYLYKYLPKNLNAHLLNTVFW